MKITLTIPERDIKRVAALGAIGTCTTLPEDFAQVVDSTPEIDITKQVYDDKNAIMAIACFAIIELIDICEQS